MCPSMFDRLRVVLSALPRVATIVAGGWSVAAWSIAGADTVEIIAARDNTLYEDDTGAFSNGAGIHLFAGTTNTGEIRRGLLAFDLDGALPAGAVIHSVSLTLNMSRTLVGAQEIELRRVTAGWGEGSSRATGQEGGGAPATDGDATWVHRFFDTETWSSPGGDFAGISATATVGNLGAYTWGSTPEMVSDVEAWLADPTSNFGWLLKVADERPSRTAKRFDSSENPTPARRPRLSIDFTPTVVAVEFRRGDANVDGAVDVSDAVVTLRALVGVRPLACDDAADSNDDGVLDISDALTTLMELFSGVPIPDPGAGSCGVDPTVDDLDCAAYAASCS